MAKNHKKHNNGILDAARELGLDVVKVEHKKMIKVSELEYRFLIAQNLELKKQNAQFIQELRAIKKSHSRCKDDILDSLSMCVYNLFGGKKNGK